MHKQAETVGSDVQGENNPTTVYYTWWENLEGIHVLKDRKV
jgi:hypothetical protein